MQIEEGIEKLIKEDVITLAKILMDKDMHEAEEYLRKQGYNKEQIKVIKKEKAQEDKEAGYVS